jgi:tetratricopeptide (TPR) repeat protein
MKMRRTIAAVLFLTLSTGALAQEDLRARRKAKETELKKASSAPEQSLAGDLTRKKEERGDMPALRYDQFRLSVELQVASKRREQIDSLKKIIGLSPDQKEVPSLLFRLAELYWEESKYYFFESNRKDDEVIHAMNRKDKAAEERAKSEKEELLAKSKEFTRLAIDRYSEIIQKYKDYERTDEVLYFLGRDLMDAGEERKALVAYRRLVDKYKKSKYYPDALLAFGEYYFNTSKGKRDMLEKALSYYKQAAAFPENQLYGFALYKQGWCYFNLADYQKAMDMFKAVVLYGEYAGASAVERDAGKSGKNTLVREARNDFVRAYARFGSPADARAEFGKVASKPDDRFLMLKQLANLYYEDGKNREAALTYNTLIRERPLSPEAPGFQGKIVDCVLRAGNKRMTVEQVRKLVKIMDDVQKSGSIKEEKDHKAMAEARELSERTLSNLAVNWHNEAKKTRDDETFALSSEVYSDYLALFPESPKAYDMRFFWAELLNDNLLQYEKAADQYTQVVMIDAKRMEGKKDAQGKVEHGKPGRWLATAAYDAVLAYDEVVKKAEASGAIKPEPAGDVTKKHNIPAQKKNLLEACDRYLKYVPNGPKRVEITFKSANIYYRYNYFDEAVARFSDIALHSPDYKFEDGQRAGEMAANLVLDSYNLLGDWAKVNEWARKFYNTPKLATGPFRQELSKVIEQSSFKLVNQLEAKKEYAKAAEAYISFVSEFPKSEIADKALYNASIDFVNANMLDKAMSTRQRLMRSYPKSEFLPASIYANGEGHEAVGDFEEAAQAYEAYVAGYERSLNRSPAEKSRAKIRGAHHRKKAASTAKEPSKETTQAWDEGKAQIALINAGILRDGLGQYRHALKDREKYLELWPDSKDSEAVFLSISDLDERNGAYTKATKVLEEYEREYGKDPSKVLAAEGRLASIYEQKLKRQHEALRTYQRVFAYYEKLANRFKKSLSNPALDAVARAHYVTSENDYNRYTGIRLHWGKLPHPETEFKQGLREKARSLEVVQRRYTQTVSFKSASSAICALMRIGMAYDNFVETLVNAPMPRGAPAELKDALREELSNNAQPVKDKAAEAFAAAVQKSRELDVYNECSTKSLQYLRKTYRPEQYPALIEHVVELKGFKSQALGADLVASLQPVTVIPPKVAKQGKPEGAEEEALDILAPNPVAAQPEPEKVVAPRQSKKKETEEPEDVL